MENLKKKKLLCLTSGIFLNLFSVFSSTLMPNSSRKISLNSFNFLLEFITINWCVWNSFLTIFYNFNEIRDKKKQNRLDFIVVVGNLVAMLIFTLNFLYLKVEMMENKPFFWWVYSIVWHYVAPINSLIYFFKFVKVKKSLNKKEILYSTSLMPILFLIANLSRGFLIDRIYLKNPYNFKKFLVPWFKFFEEGKLINFSFFCIFSLLGFWLFSLALLKLKERYFPKTFFER